jgi:hypothetical protein
MSNNTKALDAAIAYVNAAIAEMERTNRPEHGYCKDSEDKKHCACWWDEKPCCRCGFDGEYEDDDVGDITS